ncbi:MarR family winged helix-turn-helix transcriptional regulator [Enemella evansiae]|uniref:MarR family transcriptional regulator n=1 Tax=Enemella evansiae TaxID=2016499 RepID=A0A255GPL0_9ACTN|nr:MarR family transcriptional regulator [Enemella evansiae]OYN96829.1 MarR family transcriptional regulator [Enemella evansiae]OYO00762.1 MarR family transcriptional regulator [Enemella evansiae]OYO02608.1 MarR family transcriptional regulator [Enemella evansiae]OYO14051.1 MarR family transcriptional regulator [Enemella evansiae]OYO17511.1 MarR family transcriptional regulator [Enemella evansiae]
MKSSGGDVELCGLVARLNQRLDSHVRRVADRLGITSSQTIALRELSEAMTLTELAERMSCEASNAGYVIDRMAEQGLVTREPHPGDRRRKLLELTAAGQRCRRNVLTALAQQAPVDTLDAAEQDALKTLLRKATGG